MTLGEREIEEPEELRIKGAMLVKVRGMTSDERTAEGWKDYPDDIPCIEYDNGAVLYSACEHCDKPGAIYASYRGARWGVSATGEPYERPPTKAAPRWVYPAAALAVLLIALTAAGVVTLWKVNQDQRDQVQQQNHVIREQRAMMDQQRENQRTIQRLIRANQADVRKSLEDIKGQVAGVVAERNGLRSANAQLSQSNQQLQKRLGHGNGGR